MSSLQNKIKSTNDDRARRKTERRQNKKAQTVRKIRLREEAGKKPPLAVRGRHVVHHTISSLRIRNYRLYFVGQTISLCGTWMQSIGQGLLVLSLTHSGMDLGLVIALQCAPLLFLSPYGGIIANRFSKRRILFFTQSLAGLLALTLGVLVLTSTIQLWMVYVLATGLGIDTPTRQLFIHELVGPSQLSNALTLNSVITNLSRAIGPAIAGIIIASFWLSACFIINGVSFVAVLVCLRLMEDAKLIKSKIVHRAKKQLRTGFRYAWRTPFIRSVVLMTALVGMISYEFSVSLPLLASVISSGGEAQTATALAWLIASMGIGAVIGGLITAWRRDATLRYFTLSAFGFGTAMLLAALAPTLLLASVTMGFVGYFLVSFTALSNTLLQLSSAPRMRGQIMALWTMAFLGLTIFGAPLIGWVAQVASPQWSIALGAAAALAAGLIGLLAMKTTKNADIVPLLESSMPVSQLSAE
jgi:MFS family permease